MNEDSLTPTSSTTPLSSLPSLIALNRQGFIPGPEETEEAFLSRTAYCLNLKTSIEEELKETLPFKLPEEMPECFQEALTFTESFYDISPSWIPLFFSNYQLAPWQGGCAWIFKKEADIKDTSQKSSPTGAFLQLRKSFHHTKKFLGIYKRSELFAHELCHVGRMEFNEPKFEEFLAYQTSHSRWRRWVGPIAQSSWETTLFALMLLGIFLIDLGVVLFGEEALYLKLMWLKVLPLLMLLAGGIRLAIRHKQMKRCLALLRELLPSDVTARAVLYRLTDEEIISLSRMDEIGAKKDIEKKDSLRWRIIKAAYFNFPENL